MPRTLQDRLHKHCRQLVGSPGDDRIARKGGVVIGSAPGRLQPKTVAGFEMIELTSARRRVLGISAPAANLDAMLTGVVDYLLVPGDGTTLDIPDGVTVAGARSSLALGNDVSLESLDGELACRMLRACELQGER